MGVCITNFDCAFHQQFLGLFYVLRFLQNFAAEKTVEQGVGLQVCANEDGGSLTMFLCSKLSCCTCFLFLLYLFFVAFVGKMMNISSVNRILFFDELLQTEGD